jgi:hypothetical protein
MGFRKFIKTLLVRRYLGSKESPVRVVPLEEPPQEQSEPKPHHSVNYNPKAHRSYYEVCISVLKALLANPEGKTPREFSETTGFSATSLRTFCRLLHKEGVLQLTREYPATYTLKDAAAAKLKVQEFEERLSYRPESMSALN